jgi:hypothetical protein
MTQLPDFIIAGAARSGTTWLSHLLNKHPDIGMAKPFKPEPKFFLVDSLYNQGISYYSETWFSNRSNLKLGEKSTNYMEDPRVAARIYKHIPTVQLIFILRNPIERAWSNYHWSVMNGIEKESFDYAIKHENEREIPDQLRYAKPFSYIARGYYADLLIPFFKLFNREKILILKFEEIIKNPYELASKIHRFIGVDERPDDANELGVINTSEKNEESIPHKCRKYLQEIFKNPNIQLSQLVGSDFTKWE